MVQSLKGPLYEKQSVSSITAKIISNDSKNSLFSMLASLLSLMFNEATNINQLSQDYTCDFFSKTFFQICVQYVAYLIVFRAPAPGGLFDG